MLSAAMFGLLTPAKAPRTAAERDLNSLTAQVQTGKASIRTYAQYIDTLIQAGQLVKAQSALDQSLQTAKTDRSYLLAEQAQLYLANKDYQGAVTAADKAIVEAQKELKAYKDANVAANRLPDAGAQMPTSYATAALAKADSLMQTKDYAAAVKAFDAYLTQEPTDADILVLRAQAKANAGDKTGAAADYRSALTYIPDYQPALDGLKQIGAAKGVTPRHSTTSSGAGGRPSGFARSVLGVRSSSHSPFWWSSCCSQPTRCCRYSSPSAR